MGCYDQELRDICELLWVDYDDLTLRKQEELHDRIMEMCDPRNQ